MSALRSILRLFRGRAPESLGGIVEPPVETVTALAEPEPVAPVVGEICDHGTIQFYKPCPLTHDDAPRRRSVVLMEYANNAKQSVEAIQDRYETAKFYWRMRQNVHPWTNVSYRYEPLWQALAQQQGEFDLSMRYARASYEAAKEERIADLTAEAVIAALDAREAR